MVSSCTDAVGSISSMDSSSKLFWGFLSSTETATRSLTAYSWNQCNDWFVCCSVWTWAVVERSRLSPTSLEPNKENKHKYYSYGTKSVPHYRWWRLYLQWRGLPGTLREINSEFFQQPRNLHLLVQYANPSTIWGLKVFNFTAALAAALYPPVQRFLTRLAPSPLHSCSRTWLEAPCDTKI